MTQPSPSPAPDDPPGDFHVDPAGASPLSPAQYAEIETANLRIKKIRRAAAVARVDGVIAAVFAVVAVLSFCLGWEGPVLGVIIGVIAWNSFRGATRLTKLDPTAPRRLAMNQVYLATTIILYAVYELYVGLAGNPAVGKALASSGALPDDLDVDMPSLVRLIYWTLYGGVIVGTILFQGLTARYYFSRRKFLNAYLHDTPAWIVQLQSRPPQR